MEGSGGTESRSPGLCGEKGTRRMSPGKLEEQVFTGVSAGACVR